MSSGGGTTRVPAAAFTPGAHGALVPGEGWFVLSALRAPWSGIPGHAYADIAPRDRFTQYGLAVDALWPGHANGMYHREHHADESFVVLRGTVDAVVEGGVVPMGPGDVLHCPAGTAHITVATGDEPALVFMLGARGRDPEGAQWGEYVPDAHAAARGAAVTAPTADAGVAYAARPAYAPIPCPLPAWSVGGPRVARAAPAGTARFTPSPAGVRRTSGGWFVVNADELAWQDNGELARVAFDGDVPFTQYGLNLRVTRPGQPSSMYHREFGRDETFLLLDGDGLLVAEGDERPVTAGDFVHLPGGTGHTLVGAGERGAVVLMVGTRRGDPHPEAGWGEYVPDAAAARHGASAAERTGSAARAYAGRPRSSPARPPWTFAQGWVPA